jgi:hypothetical protein
MNQGKGSSDPTPDPREGLEPASDPGDRPANPPKRRSGYHRRRPARTGRAAARRTVDLSRLVNVVTALPIDGNDAAQRNRRLLAEMCKVVGAHLTGTSGVAEGLRLPPRLRQTLEGLIRGDSEKQIAQTLKLSPHTVHVYVKQLYKRFNANSRGELLSRFIRGTPPTSAPGPA